VADFAQVPNYSGNGSAASKAKWSFGKRQLTSQVSGTITRGLSRFAPNFSPRVIAPKRGVMFQGGNLNKKFSLFIPITLIFSVIVAFAYLHFIEAKIIVAGPTDADIKSSKIILDNLRNTETTELDSARLTKIFESQDGYIKSSFTTIESLISLFRWYGLFLLIFLVPYAFEIYSHNKDVKNNET
tara:strand:- start:623 stop:1177 length:555 start_codon:yes stop_codon:yes gene_type:complete